MNPMQKRLVLCCREQWLGGRFDCVELWEDGLRLDYAHSASGRYYLPGIDSGEAGFRWGRVVVDAQLPPDTALRVYGYTSDHRSWNGWTDLDEVLRAGRAEDAAALQALYGAPAAESGDFYIQGTGRYLWLAFELAATGAVPPVIRKVTVWMGGDHMVDYLPAIYQEDDFTRRFLSIFNSMFLDMETAIEQLPQRMDYENTDGEMLAYLASWVCAEGEESVLQERIATALPDYESQYTTEGIKRSVQRLTGKTPYLIEQFDVSPNRLDCRNPELYRRLYGEDPNRFFILLEDGVFPSREAGELFRRRMARLIPAGTSMELVPLKQCIQLDWHTYLGINSRVGGYVPATIDESTTIHYDTTIGGVTHEL